jgi:hypothetical protein
MASLLKHGNTCGTYLTRLAKKAPDRVIKRRGDTGFVYHIKPPIGWKPQAVSENFITGEKTAIKMNGYMKEEAAA